MTTLLDFLEARLTEDEESDWPHRPGCQMLLQPPTGFPFPRLSCNCDAATRWMCEFEAKRRVLARHGLETRWTGEDCCRCCSTPSVGAWEPWPCPELLDMASVWSDHPQYLTEWSPS